jgi:hypothetical protein
MAPRVGDRVVLAFRAVEDGAHYEAMPEVTTGPNGP